MLKVKISFWFSEVWHLWWNGQWNIFNSLFVIETDIAWRLIWTFHSFVAEFRLWMIAWVHVGWGKQARSGKSRKVQNIIIVEMQSSQNNSGRYSTLPKIITACTMKLQWTETEPNFAKWQTMNATANHQDINLFTMHCLA